MDILGIELPASHVDLMSSTTFTVAQLERRWDREVSRVGKRRAKQLERLNQIKDSLPANHPAKKGVNLQRLQKFVALGADAQLKLDEDLKRNELLKAAITYEAAMRDKKAIEANIAEQENTDIPVHFDSAKPLADAQKIIDEAGQEVLDLAALRPANQS